MSHSDRVLTRFLERQREDGLALAAASDLLELTPLGPTPTQAYLARLSCTGLVRNGDRIVEHDEFLVGIRLGDDYLRRFDTAQVLTWCEPFNVWHPNIRPPFICVGRMEPGTPLTDLLYQVFEIVAYHNVEMREFNALNHQACVWARRHVDRFPIDSRPLRRRVRTRAASEAPAPASLEQ